MHHQQATPESTAHHHHHPDSDSSDGSRMTCGCPGDILAILSGQIGIAAATVYFSPTVEVVTLAPATLQSITDLTLVPLAPPPRT
jgi:hypothetical protein